MIDRTEKSSAQCFQCINYATNIIINFSFLKKNHPKSKKKEYAIKKISNKFFQIHLFLYICENFPRHARRGANETQKQPMSDGNYIFDPENLSYEKKDPRKGRKFLIGLGTQIIAALIIGIVVFLTISYTIKSPRQKKLEKENQIMQQELYVLKDKQTKVDSVLKDIQQRDRDIYRAIFETELNDGQNSESRIDYYSSIASETDLLDTVRKVAGRQAERLTNEESAYTQLQYNLKNYKENLTEIPSVLPIHDPEVELIYYGFGQKLDPIYKIPDIHPGLDIAANIGTEVVSTANGIVERTGDIQKYGKHVVINHKNGYKTIYAHLSGTVVKKGQRIKRGELIGFVGNSGKSLTPHLHYEIQYKGQAVNPTTHTFGALKPDMWQKLNREANSRGLSLD